MRNGRAGLCGAIAFFGGCVLGLGRPVDAAEDAAVDLALAVAVAGFVLVWLLRRRTTAARASALIAVAALGWAHAGHALQRASGGSLVDRLDDQPELVRFEVELEEPFLPPDPADTDLLDRFQPDADDPPWHALGRLRVLDASDGRHAVCGLVTLVAPASAASLGAGDLVTGVGWISGVQAPRNPGERDMRSGAWRRDVVGRLKMDTVPHRVRQAPAWLRLRDGARRWIDRNLISSLQPHASGEVQALVVAMTTGRHLPGYASLRADFARTGLSHFLAISGFNVAVLFVMVMVLMELFRVPGLMRGALLTLTGALFLTLVDVEVSVLRAGLAGMLAGASMWLGRGWRGDGTLGVAALVTLVLDPWAALNPGFQLSYAAVLALRRGSGPIDDWFRAGLVASRVPTAVVDSAPVRGVRLALAASAAAWMVSTPVTLACMGIASPWCAVASTMLGPLAAALTVLASVVTVAGGLPWLGPALGWPLAWLARLFLWLVDWVGAWPGCSLQVDPLAAPLAVTVVALIFVVWTRRLQPFPRVASGAIALSLILWVALRPSPVDVDGPPEPRDTFRWTALAVGDGSVHLLEAGGVQVLFDAGSVSRQGVGSGVVVPALRALGVRTLDTIVVSHPHLDHFSAVPEVVEAFPTRRVVMSEAWLGAESRPGAPAILLACLASHGIRVEHVTQGWCMRQGPLTWTALHPPEGFRATAVNDGSLGFLIRHQALPDRPVALLLGDAQDAAIARYLTRRDLLRPWVMELPHHGGWRPMAQTLCEWVHPSFVMQSTGQRRFARDRLSPSLTGAVRGVTCRDGALRFQWEPGAPEPKVRLERWTETGWWSPAP